MKSLYELTEELLQLEATIDRLSSEDETLVTDEQVSALDKWLEQLGEQHADKIDGYAAMIRQLENESLIAKMEAGRWQARHNARENRADMLRQRMLEHMQKIKRKVLKTERTEFSIVGNGGKMPVVIYNPELLPPEFYVTPEPKEDKAAIFVALSAGKEVPGARFGERGVRLKLK